jgi:hypothetical protein
MHDPQAWSLLSAIFRRCIVATAIRLGAISERLSAPWAWPTLESMRENLRDARRKATAARHATEDFADDAALKVRRHPLRAMGVAMVTGAVVGSLVGPCIAWFGRIRA